MVVRDVVSYSGSANSRWFASSAQMMRAFLAATAMIAR